MAILTAWLNMQDRNPCPYSKFRVSDVQEATELPDDAAQHLADALLSSRVSPDYMADLAKELGWDRFSNMILAAMTPQSITLKRGDFGEVLTAEMLEEFDDYIIPIKKMRFKSTSEQSITGTDILAVRLDEQERIIEMCYVETKTRSSRGKTVAWEGAKQLSRDYHSDMPQTLIFVGQMLLDAHSPLYHSWKNYMTERADTRELDTFMLSLVFDTDVWDESILEVLEEAEDWYMPSFLVRPIVISNLVNFIDGVYGRAGFRRTQDDE